MSEGVAGARGSASDPVRCAAQEAAAAMHAPTIWQALPPRDAGFARAIAAETLRRFGQIEAVDPPLRPEAAAAAQGGTGAGNSLCRDLRASVPGRRAACRRRCRQSPGRRRRQGGALQAADQCRAAPGRARREGARRSAGCRAPQHAGLAVDALVRAAMAKIVARAIAQAHAQTTAARPHAQGHGVRATARWSNPCSAMSFGFASRRASKSLPGFAEGAWWVQDAAATLAGATAGRCRGQTVIDLCAAPGGKTMQLAARGADVVAVERDDDAPWRAERKSRARQTLRNADRERLRDFTPPRRPSCCWMRPAPPPAPSAAIPICPGSRAHPT